MIEEMTEQLSSEFQYPNINIFARYYNGEFNGYTAKAKEGYVFYEKDTYSSEPDPLTGEEKQVVYYYRIRLFPPRYNMENFNLVAVKEEDVEARYRM